MTAGRIESGVRSNSGENTKMSKSKNKNYYRSAEWKLIRKIILQRDHYKCRVCGASRKLVVHHRSGVWHRPSFLCVDNPSPRQLKRINEYRKNMLDSRRLFTICETCHRKLHTYMRERKGPMPSKFKPQPELNNIISIYNR